MHTVYRLDQANHCSMDVSRSEVNVSDEQSLTNLLRCQLRAIAVSLKSQHSQASTGNDQEIPFKVFRKARRLNVEFMREYPEGTVVWNRREWSRHPHNDWVYGQSLHLLRCRECKFTLRLDKNHGSNQYTLNKYYADKIDQGAVHGVIGIINIKLQSRGRRKAKKHLITGHIIDNSPKSCDADDAAAISEDLQGEA